MKRKRKNKENSRKRRLRTIRECAGFSSKELANYLGVSETKVLQFERGTCLKNNSGVEAINKWYLNELVKYIGHVKPWIDYDKRKEREKDEH